MSGEGHEHIRLGGRSRRNVMRLASNLARETVLRGVYDRQDIIRRANSVDAISLSRNLAVLQEIPPVIRYPRTIWSTAWEGAYESVPPLFETYGESNCAADLEALEREDPGHAFDYNYICVLRLE